MKSNNGSTSEATESGPTGLFKFHLHDARNIADLVKEYTTSSSLLDVTITSPPYHDIINYASGDNQVGFGQEYDAYLVDLGIIFKQIYNLTKESGSLWVIVDTYSKNKKLVPLPFELITKIMDSGWILKNIFIWKKDKTRPWTHRGQLRKIFEYILFFVKSQNFKFYVDRIRELNLDGYKEWWVKYPERYNPKGKIPTNIWEYPIPVQGSWRNESIKHSNPLPVGLIHRILTLVTDETDVVCDPFSGSGTVLAVADALGRKYLGFELNKDSVKNFKKTIKTIINKEIENIQLKKFDHKLMQNNLSNILLNLRLVKFPKVVFNAMVKLHILEKEDIKRLNTIFSLKLSNFPRGPSLNNNILASKKLYFVFNDDPPIFEEDEIKILRNEWSINRFQILGTYTFSKIEDIMSKAFFKNYNSLWLYKPEKVYKFEKKISYDEWIDTCREDDWRKYFYNYTPPIISNVQVDHKIRRTWISKEEYAWLEKEKYEDILNDEWEMYND